MARKKNKYDYKKTLIKFGKSLIYVLFAGIAVKYGQSPYYLGIAPLLVSLENYLKNN